MPQMSSIYHRNLSPAIQIKAAQKVLFSLICPNVIILLLTSQRLMEFKTCKIFSINWGNMPEHSWENNHRKPQCCFCSDFSWLVQHFHSHMLLTISLMSKFSEFVFSCFTVGYLKGWEEKKQRNFYSCPTPRLAPSWSERVKLGKVRQYRFCSLLISGINSFTAL